MDDVTTLPIARAQSASAPPRVAVVILNWRNADDTLACVASVAALDYPAIDIVLCDNDSGDGSLDRIEAGLPALLDTANEARRTRGLAPLVTADNTTREPVAGRVSVIATGRNGGYAFGNNVGIARALRDPDTAYVWILNNDTVVRADALTALVARMGADPRIGICGATTLYLDRHDRVQTLGGGRFLPMRARCEQIGEDRPTTEPVDAEAIEATLSYVNGAAALVSRPMIERVGLMDEGYFLYWEEIDWATRARAAGFRLGFAPDAIVYHRVGASTGSSDHGIPTLTSTYWMWRSKFRFLRRHHPFSLIPALPLLARAALGEVRAGRTPRGWAMIRGALHVGGQTKA